uniref:Uncharacterized protein n=1 Tax=Coccidioides posadasii RMSCC 3488 TaxID=454284 RepID=A0A0J6F3M3_COCPO|nr:hypothetical protein CPAG_00228 [Coccidioides posadasii RMSCC 3488]
MEAVIFRHGQRPHLEYPIEDEQTVILILLCDLSNATPPDSNTGAAGELHYNRELFTALAKCVIKNKYKHSNENAMYSMNNETKRKTKQLSKNASRCLIPDDKKYVMG